MKKNISNTNSLNHRLKMYNNFRRLDKLDKFKKIKMVLNQHRLTQQAGSSLISTLATAIVLIVSLLLCNQMTQSMARHQSQAQHRGATLASTLNRLTRALQTSINNDDQIQAIDFHARSPNHLIGGVGGNIPRNQLQIIQTLPQDEDSNSIRVTKGNNSISATTANPTTIGTTTTTTVTSAPSSLTQLADCSNGLLTFELSTGFIYKPTGSADTLSMMPSTLQLTDCLDYCLQNSSCLAINFEMGLCVLLATSANLNPQNLYSSQFPVFTIYAEKKCLLSDPSQLQSKQIRRRRCQRAWTFERVAGFEMKLAPRRRLKLATKELCMDACLSEQEFDCRSANWYRNTGACHLSDQDRHSVSQSEAGDQLIKASLTDFYGPATAPMSTTNTAPSSNLPAFVHLDYRQAPLMASANRSSSSSISSSNNQTNNDLNKVQQPASSQDSALSSKLIASLNASAKKHFKQLFASSSSASKVQSQHRVGRHEQNTPRQLNAVNNNINNDWSTAATFEGHYIDVPASTHVDYLENNCIYEPNKLCEFRKIQNRVLKTVDSIYQDVATLQECKQKCLNAPYRCYSFDYGDTSERVCRTSHLDQASLLAINEPYLDVMGAITYELATCFNVSVSCKAKEMLVQVSSSKSFNGKIYAKSRPTSCMSDVVNSLHFELAMRYHDDNDNYRDYNQTDRNQAKMSQKNKQQLYEQGEHANNNELGCDVRASSDQMHGIFSNEIVIQHHDRIMTTQDVGLSVFCRYDLGNRSVTNNIDLNIEPLGEAPVESKQNAVGSHSASAGGGSGGHSPLTITGLATTVVRSPNVTMRITNMNGQPISSATVGDRLALLFEVKEKTSPFGIFVREIVAMDGRQYLRQQHKLHQTNITHAHQHQPTTTSVHGQTASPSILYYESSTTSDAESASSTTTTSTSTPHSLINDSLIESMYQVDSVNSIQFIDSDGCPTDANLMGPLVKMDPHGHRLLAPFDAFKFPSSDMVFFRAVVTSCLAECKPAVCPNYSPSITSLSQTTQTVTSGLPYTTVSDSTNPNSITGDHTMSPNSPETFGDKPKPGFAQLLTFNSDR